MFYSKPLCARFSSFTLALFLGLSVPALLADDSTWSGAGTGDSWATPGNWLDDVVPGATSGFTNQDTATFGATGAGTVEVDENRNIKNISFSGAETYSFSGEALLLSHDGTILMGGGANKTFNNNLVLHPPDSTSDGHYTIQDSTSGGFGIILAGGVTAGDTSGTVTLQTRGNNQSLTTLQGVLADGDGTLALDINHGDIASGGTTFINGNNTFTGGTTVTSGRVNFNGNDNAFGTGDIIWNGGRVQETSNVTLANNLVFNGTMSMVSSGVTFDGDVSLGPNAAIAPNGGNQIFNGVISDGTGTTFTRLSAGAIILNAANTFTGGFIMDTASDRRVDLGHDQALGTGTLVVHGGRFGGDNRTIANAVEWNGPLHFVNTNYTFDGPIALGNEAGLDPELSANGGTRIFNGVISDGSVAGKTLSIVSLGRHTFNAENTFTGGVVTEGVNLRVGHDQALGTGTLILLGHAGTRDQTFEKNIGTINLVNDIVLDGRNDTVHLDNASGWNFQGTLTLGSEDGLTPTLNFDGGNTAVFHGVVSSGDPDAVFTKEGAGTIVFAADNTITGDIVVDGGTLQIGNGGATGLIGTAAVTVVDTTTLRFNRTGSYSAGNAIDGEGNLEIQGAGVGTFTGALTHEGTTTLSGGTTFLIDGSLTGGNGISVAAGTTLGGSGAIELGAGNITLAQGAFLAPGSETALGVLNIDSSVLDLSAIRGQGDGSLIFRLGGVTTSDRVDFGGISTLIIGGGAGEGFIFDDFDFSIAAGFTGGDYILFENFSLLPGDDVLTAGQTSGFINGFEADLFLDGDNLMLTVVPEPATVAAILGALALGLAFWRRRARAAR